ncbi:MAG: 4Fe-4S dicluster domain-containing protein [Verrucomicrobia bacterium]|nr:4Fe-4S dicluster domain-containing protein [Verrucomicrobiota bacterium]
MSMKQIDQPTLQKWVDALVEKQTVYGVQAKGDRFAFDRLSKAADLRLDYDVTILPPKKYFQPQKEVLMKFDRKGTFESVIENDPFVVFGVHPYDFVAISQMDKIFSMNNYDVHYMSRRDAATVVVTDVQTPSKDVFAGCMGTATVSEGYDVLITLLDDGTYLVDAATDKGEALISPISDARDAGDSALAAREKVWEANRKKLRKHELKMDPSEIPALMEKSYEHPVWEEKSELCYSCGSCNLVCPTCYCFDVQDELDWNLETGSRYRTWDGCMLAEFAVCAGDHNFRGRKKARYRHRYLRKGNYAAKLVDQIACIGCGRCISACTANIANPVEIFNRLLEDA